ncbi:MAG: diguanylate cyclase [Rhizobiaceae bacterium]
MDETTTSTNREGSVLLESIIRDPEMMSEVERLLSGRTRDIRLKGGIDAAFRRRNWRQTASVIRSWMIWVVLLDLFMLVQSMFLLPRELALAIVAPSGLIVPAALGVAFVWRKPRSRPILDWTLLTGMVVILLSVSWMGAVAGGELLNRYLDVMLFVAITGIVIFSVPFLQTLAIAISAMAFYLAFSLGFGDADTGITLSGFFFFASGVAATVMARRTMNILAHKSFLLELRDRKHMAQLAQANRRLERLSRIDGLTGAANRHLMRERMDELWKRDGRVALLMCDIDDFKALNDHLGHLEGDKCLVEVARIITACTRSEMDCVARFGGEEFLVLLPDLREAGAASMAERIQRNLAAAALANPRSSVKPFVTLSIGVAVGETQTMSSELLQKRADTALYWAKSAGKDRVQFWDKDMDGQDKTSNVA